MRLKRSVLHLTKVSLSMCVAALSLSAAGVRADVNPAPVVKPTALLQESMALGSVDRLEMPALDLQAIRVEDAQRTLAGLAPRFAMPYPVVFTPDDVGTWESFDNGTSMWRVRITSLNAMSINLGFSRYSMPAGGQLYFYAADYSSAVRPFTDADNETHGELWTPPVAGNDVVVEVTLPTEKRADLELVLGAINLGYRGFFPKDDDGSGESGSCNIDVVCPDGDDWRDEIATVGVISTGGSTFCTGFMVNNTAEDETPFFMTANHCGIGGGNAPSLVVFWNYETSVCDGSPDGVLTDFNTGSIFRASYSASDMTLVELDDMPDPTWEVAYAGWDRTGDDTPMAVAIHHPATDEKRISFEYDPTSTTSYLGNSSPGDGTHVKVTDWDLGTTEPGSSGSPLFDQNHRVIGQLHGGYAACGNNDADWYGKFSLSWSNGLSSYLDPIGSGVDALDTLAPFATGMRVSPGGDFNSEGPGGGPFNPASVTYTVQNNSDAPIDFSVSKSASWIDISSAGGTVPVDGEADVIVSINSNANGFGNGHYEATVSFVNDTDHDGDADRTVALDVGVPAQVYEFPLSSDPGWQRQGSWDFGQPTGGGGQYGGPDPTSGKTGANVLGYNLNGDYTNDMPERHLTTDAIDCSNLSRVSLKFWRWLGVEQPSYDHAYVRVSNDGSTWTTVWQNSGEITDSSWSQVEYDISDVADGAATVYVRWTMGTTDGSWLFCGWNIDDVEIWGVQADTGLGGDLDGDGCVDQTDLGILLASYGVNDGGDIDGDGDTDQADLGALLSQYGEGC